MKKFLMLAFDIQRERAYLRIKVWRKLKELEAVLKYGSHWILPYNKANLAELKKICNEIRAVGGKAEVIKGESIG